MAPKPRRPPSRRGASRATITFGDKRYTIERKIPIINGVVSLPKNLGPRPKILIPGEPWPVVYLGTERK